MAKVTVDLDPELLAKARELTGETSDQAVLTLALRRLTAAHQKAAMVDGIAALTELPDGLGAPTQHPR